MKIANAALVAASVAVACFPTATPEVAVAPQAVSTSSLEGLTDLARDLGSAACGPLLACCNSLELQAYLHDASEDPAACARDLQGRYAVYVQHLQTGILAGRLTYHADKAKRCLQTFANLPCGEYANMHARGPVAESDCDTWLEPRVELGDSCSDDDECISAYCAGRRADSDAVLSRGRCEAPPAVGQRCYGTCARGTYCDMTATLPICLPTLANDSRCTAGNECTSGICDDHDDRGEGRCASEPESCLGSSL